MAKTPLCLYPGKQRQEISTAGEIIGGSQGLTPAEGLPTASPRLCNVLFLSSTKRKLIRKEKLLIL